MMIDIKNTNTTELLNQANEIFDQTRPFAELMMRYKCAMLEVKTKLDVLNTQLSLENDRNPFESIACRLKSVPSIIEKLNHATINPNAVMILIGFVERLVIPLSASEIIFLSG